MIAQIPYYFINHDKFLRRDGIVADFFCGSGTVLVEASLANHRSIGIDINPLGILISKVKSTPIKKDLLDRNIERFDKVLGSIKDANIPEFVNRDFWFSRTSCRKLAIIKHAIETATLDPDCRDFLRVCFSSTIRRSSNADPRISPPVYSKEMRKANAKGRKVHVFRNFKEVVTRNRVRLVSFSNQVKKQLCQVTQSDSRYDKLERESIDLVITSPPYMDAQKYMRSSKLELYWLGFTQEEFCRLDRDSIGTEKISFSSNTKIQYSGLDKIDNLIYRIEKIDAERAYVLAKYIQDMRLSLRTQHAALSNSGKLILVIGNNKVAGLRIPMDKCLQIVAEDLGFQWNGTLVDAIVSRGFMTKRNKTAGIIDSERILILEK